MTRLALHIYAEAHSLQSIFLEIKWNTATVTYKSIFFSIGNFPLETLTLINQEATHANYNYVILWWYYSYDRSDSTPMM